MKPSMIGLMATQALAEYGAASGIAASAQRGAERLLSTGSEHLPLILGVLAGLVVVWTVIGRRSRR